VEVVAHHLQVTAIGWANPTERDQFGRSSYNRYYYATFLSVREVLMRLRPEWSALAHATYPEVLKGKISKALSKGRNHAQKVQDKDLVRQCHRAIVASNDLAKLLKASYAIRLIADYNPEILVDFVHASRFTLNNVEITEAHQWPERAKTWAYEIERAWRQVSV
jgi:hypothetical protein